MTDAVSVYQIKLLTTELATTGSCMVFIETHDPKVHLAQILDIANKTRDPVMMFVVYVTRVATHDGLDKCLGLDWILDCLLLLNFWPHILAFLPTIASQLH